MDKLGYSVEEGAEITGLGRSKMYELLASNEVESVKVGRRRIIPAEALRAFMDKLLAAARAERDSAKSV
jgi:excisionase family DNA binding protein